MVKHFLYKTGSDLENIINNWLNINPNINVLSINYQIYLDSGEFYHNALVFYEIKTN